MIHRFLDS